MSCRALIPFTEPQKSSGWMGPQEAIWSNLSDQAGAPTGSFPGPCSYRFQLSPRVDVPQTLSATHASAQSHSEWKSISWCSERIPWASICAHHLWSCSWAQLRRVRLHPPFIPLSGDYRHWWDPSEPSLLKTEQTQLSQPFLIGEMLQFLKHLCSPSLASLQYISLILGCLELNTLLSVHQIKYYLIIRNLNFSYYPYYFIIIFVPVLYSLIYGQISWHFLVRKSEEYSH